SSTEIYTLSLHDALPIYVNNEQRKIIYTQRDEILAESSLQDYIEEMIREVMQGMIANYIPPESIHDQWDIEGLELALREELSIRSEEHTSELQSRENLVC